MIGIFDYNRYEELEVANLGGSVVAPAQPTLGKLQVCLCACAEIFLLIYFERILLKPVCYEY